MFGIEITLKLPYNLIDNEYVNFESESNVVNADR